MICVIKKKDSLRRGNNRVAECPSSWTNIFAFPASVLPYNMRFMHLTDDVKFSLLRVVKDKSRERTITGQKMRLINIRLSCEGRRESATESNDRSNFIFDKSHSVVNRDLVMLIAHHFRVTNCLGIPYICAIIAARVCENIRSIVPRRVKSRVIGIMKLFLIKYVNQKYHVQWVTITTVKYALCSSFALTTGKAESWYKINRAILLRARRMCSLYAVAQRPFEFGSTDRTAETSLPHVLKTFRSNCHPSLHTTCSSVHYTSAT